MSNDANLRGMLNQAIAEREQVISETQPVEAAPMQSAIETEPIERELQPLTRENDPEKQTSVREEMSRTQVSRTQVSQTQVSQTDEEEPSGPKQDPTRGETNFRALRDKKRELERRNYELERYIEANLNNAKPHLKQQEPEEEQLPDPDDEGLVDGRQYKALKKEIHRYKQELHTERQERTKALAEMKLLAKYPDVYDVVTRDTMEELMHVSPEEAATILNDPNPYTQHVSAYKAIKRYNIGADEPYLADRAKAKQNLAKPKPASALPTKAANSPLASVENYYGPMSSEEKAALRREMDDAINNRYR